MLVYIALRLTEAQVRELDQYRERFGHLARSTAARSLLAKQLRYEAWAHQRQQKNLPPFPTSRILKVEPPTPDRAVELAEIYRNRYPSIDDAGVAKLITGSATAYKSLRVKIADLVRRGNRERKNAQLERDMGADYQTRQAEQNSGGNR